MQHLKQFFIPLAALIALSVSCKKSSPTAPSTFITATIGGNVATFNAVPPVASTTSVAGITTINIQGVLSTATGESIQIQLDNANGGGPLVARTYADTSQVFDVAATYFADLSDQFLAGNAVAIQAAASSISLAHHFQLVITSVNSEAIAGTFTGDFFVNGDPGSTVKSVTNGSFNVNFQ